MKRILIIDDDSYILNLMKGFLEQKGYKAQGSLSGMNGIKLFDKESFDIVLCDFRLPDTDGYRILQHVKAKKPAVPLIIMTAYSDVKMAVKLIKSGAFDYIVKPIQPEEILHLLQKALSIKKGSRSESIFMDEFIVGESEGIKTIMEYIDIIAPTQLNVLIEGETGSGKEFIARKIHNDSKRKNKPFVAVDCGAMPKSLANSELFGHVKGAFTGAISDKRGHFMEAQGGTIFLDEVGNLPYENQAKLLRALQERVISRIGENTAIKIDVRLIAASNQNLYDLVKKNEFREDLYHRLNEFKLSIPPLREREGDIMIFIDSFIDRANKMFNKTVEGVDDETKSLLTEYPWYGNIRELQNVINRAVLLTGSGNINPLVLPDEIRYTNIKGIKDSLSGKKQEAQDLKEATGITEKEMIYEALLKANFNKTKAAKLLNIDRKTLYNKIKLYGIDNQR